MRVRQILVGPMKNFVYLLVDEESREAIVIDSGWETGPVTKAVSEEKARVKYVVATHGHFDHVGTIKEMAEVLGADVVVHEESELEANLRVRNGDRLTLGTNSVTVMHTPGHTKDSVCLYDGVEVFTGDTLFIGNCGRTDLPGGSAEQLFHSLKEILLKLPPETVIYPGHDYGEVPSRRMGEEAELNPTLRAGSLRDFLGEE